MSNDGQSARAISPRHDASFPAAASERIDPFGNRVLESQDRDAASGAGDHRFVPRAGRAAAGRRRRRRPGRASRPRRSTSGSLASDSPAVALYPSRRIPLFDEATAYARKSFSAGRPVYEAALELATRIRSDFVYDPEATEVEHAGRRPPSSSGAASARTSPTS